MKEVVKLKFNKNILIYFIILLVFISIFPFSYGEENVQDINDNKNQNEIGLGILHDNLKSYVLHNLIIDVLFPSATSQSIGNFLMTSFTKKTSFEVFGEDTYLHALATPGALSMRYCRDRMSSFFQPSYDHVRSGPSINDASFIYGMYQNYPNLLNDDGDSLNLYTFSLRFNHPLTEEEILELTPYDLDERYSLPPSGEIEISIVFENQDSNEKKETGITILKPGKVLDLHYSFYDSVVLDKIYLNFHEGYKHKFRGYDPSADDGAGDIVIMTSDKFPKYPCHEDLNNDVYGKLGCIYEVENYDGYPHGSSLVVEEDENGDPHAGGVIVNPGSGSSTDTGGFLPGLW